MCLERRGKNRIIDAERTTTKSGRIFRVELKDQYAFFFSKKRQNFCSGWMCLLLHIILASNIISVLKI